MNYYSEKNMVTTTGVFIGYIDGYATFNLENGDIIDFDQINKEVLENFELKLPELKSKNFELTYQEILDDEDDEDFVVFRLEKLKLR